MLPKQDEETELVPVPEIFCTQQSASHLCLELSKISFFQVEDSNNLQCRQKSSLDTKRGRESRAEVNIEMFRYFWIFFRQQRPGVAGMVDRSELKSTGGALEGVESAEQVLVVV